MVGREHENCGASEGVFLVCGSTSCPPPPPVEIRLSGGRNDAEGILEATLWGANNWGPVCDDYFDQDGIAASVVCRQLGYLSGGGSAKHCDVHVPTPNFMVDDVHCPNPLARSLAECAYTTTHNCGVSEGVWIQCDPNEPCNAPLPPPPPPSSSPSGPAVPDVRTPGPQIMGMRLTGGHFFSGRLEVTYDGLVWGPVCDDWFDVDDHQVEVVCRQLGFLDERGGQTGKGHSTWMRDDPSVTGYTQETILDAQGYNNHRSSTGGR